MLQLKGLVRQLLKDGLKGLWSMVSDVDKNVSTSGCFLRVLVLFETKCIELRVGWWMCKSIVIININNN